MSSRFTDRVFLVFLAVISLAFMWVVTPFFGAILWATVVAIVFAPVNRWVSQKLDGRPNIAAVITLTSIIALVIIPAALIITSLVTEVSGLVQSIQSREIDVVKMGIALEKGLPRWAVEAGERFGLTDINVMSERVASTAAAALRAVGQTLLGFGQGAFSFFAALGVMLYLVYFLIRDGDEIAREIGHRLPLQGEHKALLLEKFTVAIRATIRGSVIVAIVQGTIGGIVFWFLDIRAALLAGVLMGLLSLIPAVGTGFVWAPVAIYLLATGSIWQGVTLILCGVFLIGMIDNTLRPILVGQDTRIPDYIVLVSTLGGLAIFGLNGFVVGPVVAALFLAAWEIFGADQDVSEQPIS
ncbi:MAG: AI-2E family transporter [Sphingomonadaceae bacterium]